MDWHKFFEDVTFWVLIPYTIGFIFGWITKSLKVWIERKAGL